MHLQKHAILIGSLLTYSAGCTGQSTTTQVPAVAPVAATSDAHDHPSEGPHHGALVELGSGEYHAEVTHDASSVTVYILDAQATQAVPIDAGEVTLNLMQAGKPAQYKLTASPEQGEPAGKASRFNLSDAELLGSIQAEAATAKLSLTIDGTPYRGEFNLAHDHDRDHTAHDHTAHDHGDHSHTH